MSKQEELEAIADLKLDYKDKFIALRNTKSNELGRLNIAYSSEKGEKGSKFEYVNKTDTLYTSGFGLFVLYENCKWFDDPKEIQLNYEIY